MKIECVKEKLHMAVSKAEKIVGKNANLPVLSCLLFETKGNNLIIRSTNLDLGLEISIPVKVGESGKVAIPANVISSFLNNITDDKNIILETIENTLKISTQSSEANIKTLSTEDFPTIPMVDSEKTCKINSKDLINGIRSVIYSSSLSSVKPELSSVYIYTHDDDLMFVATDSFRLAEKSIKMRKNIDLNPVLIPFKNASDILKIIDNTDTEIEINSTKNQISFVFNGMYLVSRVIDGVFPDYKQILPKEEKTKVVLLKQDLVNSLKISNIFSDSFNQMNISVKKGEKIIKVRTKNSNVGENTNKIDANIEGEDIEVNFNYKYIVDCLPSIVSDSVSLIFNGMNKALIIRGTSDKTFTYLVMPMNR
ncbi:MAG: DNA polymerase III subunit beta [Candidatus Paceibacterota bacterium]|jgi:DNA polymerase-3 subunit beta